MSYEKLKEFVEEQNHHGVAEITIREALVEKGWNGELIDKAISEVFITREEQDPTKIRGLLKNTWENFKEFFPNYIIITLISVFLPFIPIIVFSAPIIYDVLVLKFTLVDFTSGAIMPLMVFYVFVSFLIIMIFALWGKLSLTMMAASNGDVSVGSTLRKAWKSLTGYIWISFLSFAITTALLIPSLVIIAALSLKLIPVEFSLLFIGIAFILCIPAIIATIFLVFTPYAYVIHGARGFTAIRTTYKLVKNNFEFVFTKILLFGIIFLVVNVILSMIPLIGEILKIALNPIVAIFMTKLFFITEKLNKNKVEEVI